MKKLQAVLGYTAASLATLLVLVVIFLLVGGGLDTMISAATGLTLAPSINGGEVTRTIPRGAYQVQIHRMVFDGLIGQRREGFIQVDWTPLTGSSRLDRRGDRCRRGREAGFPCDRRHGEAGIHDDAVRLVGAGTGGDVPAQGVARRARAPEESFPITGGVSGAGRTAVLRTLAGPKIRGYGCRHIP